MPRSVQEIDAEIAQVLKLIDERDRWEATDRRAPEYRAARFDYILGGDRSGLDSFISRVNAANEARKQREFSMAENEKNRAQQVKLAEEAKKRSKQEDMDLAMKNLRDSENLLDKSMLEAGTDYDRRAALSGMEYDIARAERAGIPASVLAAYKEKHSNAASEAKKKAEGQKSKTQEGDKPAGEDKTAGTYQGWYTDYEALMKKKGVTRDELAKHLEAGKAFDTDASNAKAKKDADQAIANKIKAMDDAAAALKIAKDYVNNPNNHSALKATLGNKKTATYPIPGTKLTLTLREKSDDDTKMEAVYGNWVGELDITK